MAYLLDTSILIHAYEGHPDVVSHMARHGNALTTSTLCLAELRRGLYRRPGASTLARARLDMLIGQIEVLDFNTSAVDAYEQIIAHLGFARGRDFDRMIAAHAISLGAALVTNNVSDFAGILGLALENWAAAP